ncbi:terminase large subunit [Allosphingosinicella indica]|uniref:Phage terminase-like protein, large subunit, contains N-terminal HTH domain n=1 Tax=Allosphingosinicella indica TaxID=941907 RepID=A0A1X7GKW7_9SPHN|nr:terminase TerL endonuclease subunit [Allosphingosinicella indica]SMF70594.1 Phage terminase-like protein, large subunit, contains N-terminal HTH domain [Allosphingosinicella indica]
MAAAKDGWDFACPGWEARLRSGSSLVPELPLDEKQAAKAVAVFNRLRLPDVKGQPPLAEAAGDWFRDIVAALFGSVDADHVRHVAELFALVGKKNSKTTGGAAIMLTALILEEDFNQEYHLYGPTQPIAELAFYQAVGMIRADPEGYLQQRYHVKDHVKTIVDLVTNSQLKVKTFDMKVATGTIPKGVLLDEVHIMSSYSFAARVIGQIRGGMITRTDSFLAMITTQSDEPPAGVFRSELQLARAVRDGRVTGKAARVLPVLYEFPEAMQIDPERPWADPANWPMVVPNLGLSINMERLEAEFAQAEAKGEDELRRWASQHLNVEIGLALHSDRWIGADYWEDASEDGLTLDALMERSDVAVVGIDGGGLDDLLGVAVIGRDRVTRKWLLWCHAWAQPDVLERRKEIAARLRDFADDGELTICAGPTEDIEGVVSLLVKLKGAGLLPEKDAIGLDPYGVAALIDEAAAQGIEDEQMMGIAQGWRLNSAVLGTERKLKDGTLRHAAQRLMAWCVGNAKAEQRGNNVVITKQAAGKAKIDPLVAVFNAVMLMSRNPEGGGTGVADWLESLRR